MCIISNKYSKSNEIYIILIQFFIFTHFNYAQTKSTLTTDQIKGKVKTLTQSIYTAELKNGKPEKSNKLSTEKYSYDEQGNVTELYNINADTSVISIKNYSYNESGQVTEVSQFKSGGDMSNKDIPMESELQAIEVYVYDTKGNLIEKKYNSLLGNLSHSVKYIYDAQGNMIAQNEYNAEGKLMDKIKFYFDIKGNINEKARHDNDSNLVDKQNAAGALQLKETCKYENDDIAGNWQKETIYESDKVIKITEWVFVYY